MTAGHNFWLAYAFLILAGAAMYAPYGPFFAIIPEMLPMNVAGEVIALINSCGALGGFAGTWLVGLLQAMTGNSRAGYFFMSMSLLLAGAIISRLQPPEDATNNGKLARS
jgi:nitrate/nitrite transporter NarK